MLKVAWAHPGFGQVLATCSLNCFTAIWEEICEFKNIIECTYWFNFLRNNDCWCFVVFKKSHSKSLSRHWVRRINLNNFLQPVTDIKFGSNIYGLIFATFSTDRIISIFVSSKEGNVLSGKMNLTNWEKVYHLDLKITFSHFIRNPVLTR